MQEDKTFEILSKMIDDAFSTYYTKEKTMQNQEEMQYEVVTEVSSSTYESIEDYKAKTGKRFRMLKEQKERGLTRDEAFAEIFGANS
jgi:metal-responsive CopG/Arc/MetJ family transcriptional regulator